MTRRIRLVIIGVIFVLLLPGQNVEGATTESLRLGQGIDGPWWMATTALSKSGALRLDAKPWWEKAVALEPGDSFLLEDGRGLVRRESFKDRAGKTIDAIVWVIDDNEDDSLRNGGDRSSDCYVADYDRDGAVDRMVDYIDSDDDGDPDTMDIRYFVDGELRYCWFGDDIDDDSAMWSLRGYEYGGNSFFESDPYGDNMIYMNKLNTEKGTWIPISECPFAFYDTDADGYSEVVVRCSAVPIGYDPAIDPDYANDYGNFSAPWNPLLEKMGIVNIRYGFDVDNLSSQDTPLHYDFGFNLVGAAPYEFPGMHHYNPKRRPPQTVTVTPWKDLCAICDTYKARETGFSWCENPDDAIRIGYGEHRDDDYRWEGVFWTWERRFMENTGGPCQKWNIRREYSTTPTSSRMLYYSGVDRRIHLKDAKEGWTQVGHFAGMDSLGEIRMFDTDGNGYFDRWEYDFGDWKRIATVRDEKVRDIPWDYEALSDAYTNEMLPKAMQANSSLMAAMNAIHPFNTPPEFKQALGNKSVNCQRYAQDVLRELQYADFFTYWSAIAADVLKNQPMDDLRRLTPEIRATQPTSQTAWDLQRVLSHLDQLYGQGDYEEAGKLIETSAEAFGILSKK